MFDYSFNTVQNNELFTYNFAGSLTDFSHNFAWIQI